MNELLPPPDDAPVKVLIAWHHYESARDSYLKLAGVSATRVAFTPAIYRRLRKKSGMTLKQVSELSGYGIGTINGLEKSGKGSRRLREKLREIYTPFIA